MKVLTTILKKLVIANIQKRKYETIVSGLRDVSLQLMQVFGEEKQIIKHNKKSYKVSVVSGHQRIYISPTKETLDLLHENGIMYMVDVKPYITIEEIKP